MAADSFIDRARRAKVAKLLTHVPVGDNAAVARRLEVFTPRMREVFAAGAKVNAPSEETWSLLCAAVRARKAVA